MIATILITGASRGIGREMALRFARDGANIAIGEAGNYTIDLLLNDAKYTYRVTSALAYDGTDGCTEAQGGVTAAAQGNGFTASAVANIDADDTCDGWNINDSNALWNPQDDVSN